MVRRTNSPLYDAMGNTTTNNDMLSAFRRFKQEMGNIDPKQKVMEALQNGVVSQQEFNRFQQMANQLQGLLK